jgi:hypothetical protein
MQRHEVRLTAAGGAALAAAGIIASFAAVGFAGRSGLMAEQQYGDRKVTICHHAQGKKGTKHVTIRISRNALPAHLRHGDTVGACNTRAARVTHAKKAHVKKFHKTKAKKGKGKPAKRGKGERG